jgi:DNA-binding CsgD family transcriptional regulator
MESVVRAEEVGSAWLSQQAGGLGWGLVALMEEWAHGVLVVGPQGRLLHANQAARHELARRLVLSLEGGELRACTPEGTAKLHDAVPKALAGKRSLVSLPALQGQALSIAVLPFKSEAAEAGFAALVFARVSVCDSLMLCFFARSHGLTAAEEQVLGVLCQGHSAPEVARQLRVAVSTVRSHVRSLCAKTGAGSVRELVTRVATLPPVTGLRQEPVH